MINRAVLVGRLTRDIDLRSTGSGHSVASFTLAVDSSFKNAQGEKQTSFISCVAWNKAAEILSQYTHKGSQIGVDGRIQTRAYDNKDGQRVFVTEVVVDQFSFLESKNEQQGGQSGGSANYSSNGSNSPKRQNGAKKDPFSGNGQTVDISDDDLPF